VDRRRLPTADLESAILHAIEALAPGKLRRLLLRPAVAKALGRAGLDVVDARLLPLLARHTGRLVGMYGDILPLLIEYGNRCWRISPKERFPKRNAAVRSLSLRGLSAGQIGHKLGMSRRAVLSLLARDRRKAGGK
jgi:DNA-binding CsgD family transcriptional regulator